MWYSGEWSPMGVSAVGAGPDNGDLEVGCAFGRTSQWPLSLLLCSGGFLLHTSMKEGSMWAKGEGGTREGRERVRKERKKGSEDA